MYNCDIHIYSCDLQQCIQQHTRRKKVSLSSTYTLNLNMKQESVPKKLTRRKERKKGNQVIKISIYILYDETVSLFNCVNMLFVNLKLVPLFWCGTQREC